MYIISTLCIHFNLANMYILHCKMCASKGNAWKIYWYGCKYGIYLLVLRVRCCYAYKAHMNGILSFSYDRDTCKTMTVEITFNCITNIQHTTSASLLYSMSSIERSGCICRTSTDVSCISVCDVCVCVLQIQWHTSITKYRFFLGT